MLVAQARLAKRPRRQNRVSSRPSASVWAIRPVSASSSAAPQRRTDALTVCQSQPSASAVSVIGSPRPARLVAQRPARAVSSARPGAISGSCSVNDGAPQPERGQRQRRLCHTSRLGRPNAARSTSTTWRSPLDHNGPPQPSQPGLGARRRMCTRNGSPASSSTPSTSTSPSPTISSQTRVGSHSTGILQIVGCLGGADSGGSLAFSRGCPLLLLPPHFRRASDPALLGAGGCGY